MTNLTHSAGTDMLLPVSPAAEGLPDEATPVSLDNLVETANIRLLQQTESPADKQEQVKAIQRRLRSLFTT